MIKITFICLFLFSNLVHATNCDSLNTGNTISIWKQILDSGDVALVTWPDRNETVLESGKSTLIGSWIQKFVRSRLFAQYELKNGESYTMPIQGMYSRERANQFYSMNMMRVKQSDGKFLYTISNLKMLDADQFLELLSKLGSRVQQNWIITKQGFEMPAGLSAYLNVPTSSTEAQLRYLFQNSDISDELKAMKPETELIKQSGIIQIDKKKAYEPRRFVFYKDGSGKIVLLSYGF